MNKVIKGNCFDILKSFEKNGDIKLVLTDPPYLHNKGGGKTSGTEGKSSIANSPMYKFDSFMMEEMSSFGEDASQPGFSDLPLRSPECKPIVVEIKPL